MRGVNGDEALSVLKEVVDAVRRIERRASNSWPQR